MTDSIEDGDISDPNIGNIYVLSNPAMPNLVKIGKTKNDSRERAIQLSAHPGVPLPFSLEIQWMVSDFHYSESMIHNILRRHRLSKEREFFSINTQECIEKIEWIFKETEKDISKFWWRTLTTDTYVVPKRHRISIQDINLHKSAMEALEAVSLSNDPTALNSLLERIPKGKRRTNLLVWILLHRGMR